MCDTTRRNWGTKPLWSSQDLSWQWGAKSWAFDLLGWSLPSRRWLQWSAPLFSASTHEFIINVIALTLGAWKPTCYLELHKDTAERWPLPCRALSQSPPNGTVCSAAATQLLSALLLLQVHRLHNTRGEFGRKKLLKWSCLYPPIQTWQYSAWPLFTASTSGLQMMLPNFF